MTIKNKSLYYWLDGEKYIAVLPKIINTKIVFIIFGTTDKTAGNKS